MSIALIEVLKGFETFVYDASLHRIVNQRFQEDTNIDEFLTIQNLLDNFRVRYKFDKNFDIQLVK